MEVIKFNETKKIWHQIAKHTTNDDFSFGLEIHRKLLNIFQTGDFYYYIFNCGTASVELVSSSVKQMLGLNSEEDFTIEYLLKVIHPDDLIYFIDFEKRVTSFFNQLPPDKVLKYKVTYDYRIRAADGKYKRILQQVVTIQSDEHGAVIRVLGIHTDISHLKKENGSTLSFIGLDGLPSYHNVCSSVVADAVHEDILTRREKQIYDLMVEGKTSPEIAATLFISKLTVDGHRKSILRKTKVNSVKELIIKSMK